MTNYRRPMKSLGQNFLIDGSVVDNIIRAANLQPDDQVLEIGPGRGALTRLMADRVARLVLIEFDHALAAELQKTYSHDPRITVIDADVLAVDLATILQGYHNWKVVANLPYNISTAVLFRLLEVRSYCSRLILMLQREVGERLVASPDCSDYGVTTLLLGLWFDMRREFIVRPGSFNPPPKVESAVLSFVPLPAPRAEVGDEELFRRTVKAAFGMRRKTLNNCLKAAGLVPDGELEKLLQQCGIDGRRRGETLSLDEFAALSRLITTLTACP